MDSGDETMEGWLEKRRDKFSFLWRRYWFQLKGGKLCYFKSRDCTTPHGVINVNKIKTIGEAISTGKNFSFVLFAEKPVILAAGSSEECEWWIETLLSKSSSARRSSSQWNSVWYTDAPPVDRLTGAFTSTENGATTNRNWTRTEARDWNSETAPTQRTQPTREPPPIPQRPPTTRKPSLKTPPLPPKLGKYSTPGSQGCASPASPTLEKLTIEDSDDDDVFEEEIYDTPRPYPETLQDKACPVKTSSS
ncbi:rho GTPase-activating protein gacFF-like [Lethenteron reissneri]|uniref:rho GTPase-activating protein gacFF-like n=1 Tax=Lethenteron reissneri TaxID=7753 RepID=UPI002AB6245D|nr:rho GTPase-activating protein gacFF-like [Lethenteron reissneri]